MSVRLDAMNAHLDAFRSKQAAFRFEQNAFRAEMSAFRAEMRSEFQAQRNIVQNEVLCETRPLRERLALFEARHT